MTALPALTTGTSAHAGRYRVSGLPPVILLLGLTTTGGCSKVAGPADDAGSVSITPEAALIVGLDNTFRFSGLVRDANGNILSTAGLIWRSLNLDVATIDPNTAEATSKSPGTATIKAVSGSASDTARLEVYLDPNIPPFAVGDVRFGRERYVEYLVGDLPVILAAPHGGLEAPDEIPNRTTVGAPIVNAPGSIELVGAIATAFLSATGMRPHVVINHVDPDRMNPDADRRAGTQANTFAQQAWEEYHRFLDYARDTVVDAFGFGLFVNIAGHDHPDPRLELGYLVTSLDLNTSDATLNASGVATSSSIRTLVQQSPDDFATVLRGASSLGAFLSADGYVAVPSPLHPDPAGQPYFQGGFSVERYGSRSGSLLSGIQIAVPPEGIAATAQSRAAFAGGLVDILASYLIAHFGSAWGTSP